MAYNGSVRMKAIQVYLWHFHRDTAFSGHWQTLFAFLLLTPIKQTYQNFFGALQWRIMAV